MRMRSWCPERSWALLLAFAVGCAAGASDSESGEVGNFVPARDVDGRRGPDDGIPELPRVYLDTRVHAPNAKARRIEVAAGGDLQRALDDAEPGDVVLLAPGATFVGPFTLPKKNGNAWITIRSAAPDAALPPEGTRMSPTRAPFLPKIITRGSDPALRTAPGAHHYRLVALEIGGMPGVERNYGILELGGDSRHQRDADDIPHDIILDRLYVHGHPALSTRRCIALNSASTAIIDSYVAECHDKGFDSQAVCGWNGPGPYKIVNNYLEGAGENVMFGGGDPGIRGLIPSDIEFRRNYVFKPISWKGVWTVKNSFELKNAHRVLVEGNVFENNWADGQNGFALVFKSANQSGGAPWSETRDVTVRLNRIVNSGSGVDIMAQGSNIDTPANHLLFHDNVFLKIGGAELNGTGRLWQITEDPFAITFDHNTGFAPHHLLMLDDRQKTHVVIRNNMLGRGEYGIFGSAQGEGMVALRFYLPNAVVKKNVIVGARAESYPADNFYPATSADVGFVDFDRGDYRLTPRSAFRRAGSDGRDIGANVDAIDSATAGVTNR